jgi:hypothetical protein
VNIGMKADEVLKMKGRGKADAIAMPTILNDDAEGKVVAWHYVDCDVLLHWRLGCYRVREVTMKGEVG